MEHAMADDRRGQGEGRDGVTGVLEIAATTGSFSFYSVHLIGDHGAHAARCAFAGGSTTGSCSGVRSTFLAVHLITQSVCV